jgi:hypothetical protein
LHYVPKVEPSVDECLNLGAFYLHDEAGELDEAEKILVSRPLRGGGRGVCSPRGSECFRERLAATAHGPNEHVPGDGALPLAAILVAAGIVVEEERWAQIIAIRKQLNPRHRDFKRRRRSTFRVPRREGKDQRSRRGDASPHDQVSDPSGRVTASAEVADGRSSSHVIEYDNLSKGSLTVFTQLRPMRP